MADVKMPYVPGSVLDDEQTRYVREFLRSEIQDVMDGNDRKDFLDKVQKWRRMARLQPEVAQKTYPWQNASNVVTPIMAQKKHVIFAKLISMFSSKRPFWDVECDDPELLPVVNALSRYMNYLASAPFHLNIDEVNRTMFDDLVLLGTQVVKVPWLFEQWQIKTDAGMANRVMHNGPAIVPVRLEDFLVRSYYDDIQRAPWVGFISWLTQAELKQRESSGIYENVEDVLEAYQSEMRPDLADELERRGFSTTMQNAYDETKLYPVVECYMFYDADGDGVPEDIKVWIEPSTGTVLRSENNLLGVRDAVVMTYMKVPRHYAGLGIGHLLEGLQEEGDFLHNFRADNLHLSLLPIYKRRRGSMNVKREELHPMKIIDLDDPGDLMPMVTPDLTGPTYQAEMLVRDYADRVSGANDPMSGYADPVMKSGADVSSTMFLAQQGNSILNAIYEGIEHNYGEIGQLILIQLVANKEKVDLSMMAPEDIPLIQAVLESPIETLPTTFRFKVKTTDISRTEDAKNAQLKEATAVYVQYGQQMMQLFAVMGNPQAPAEAKMFAQQMFVGGTMFAKQIMKSYKIENVDALFPDVGGQDGASSASGANAGGEGGAGLGGGGGNAPGGAGGVPPVPPMAPAGAPQAPTG